MNEQMNIIVVMLHKWPMCTCSWWEYRGWTDEEGLIRGERYIEGDREHRSCKKQALEGKEI